ncbi:50S ribosomal protein L30 [bacterium]|nr:50S ribosomal protein L30 [bacterium]
MAEKKMLKITQTKSAIGYNASQKQVLLGLGLKKMHQTVIRTDTPEIRGMITKISHLLTWEQIEGKSAAKQRSKK